MTVVSASGIWQALRRGWCLMCPQCGKTRLSDRFRSSVKCGQCGLPFRQAEDGDFLVTVVMVYALAAVIVGSLVIAFNVLSVSLSVAWQIVVCLIVGLGIPMSLYRRFQGLTAAILYVTFGRR